MSIGLECINIDKAKKELKIGRDEFISYVLDDSKNEMAIQILTSLKKLKLIKQEITNDDVTKLADSRLMLKINKIIYETMEQKIIDLLAKANKKQNVSIKLFKGIALDSIYTPKKSKINNLTGEHITVEGKIKPKVNMTDNYCERLNLHNK